MRFFYLKNFRNTLNINCFIVASKNIQLHEQRVILQAKKALTQVTRQPGVGNILVSFEIPENIGTIDMDKVPITIVKLFKLCINVSIEVCP